MTTDKIQLTEAASATVQAQGGAHDRMPLHGRFEIECHGADGALKWREVVDNLVTTVGVNFMFDTLYRGSAYTAAWYVGLKGAGSAANSDTMSSHPGWSEVTAYSNATRPAFSPAAAASRSSTNTASPAAFTINGTATVAGMFLTTNNTVGGTTGTLFNATDFSASRGVISGDVLSVIYTISA